VQPESTDDVVCAWNDGSTSEYDYEMCVVNAINSDNSIQVICDCQQSGLVKIESDLAAPSEDLELLEEASLLAEEEEEEVAGETKKETTTEKKKSSSVLILCASLLLIVM